jgi:hypothetical protein
MRVTALLNRVEDIGVMQFTNEGRMGLDRDQIRDLSQRTSSESEDITSKVRGCPQFKNHYQGRFAVNSLEEIVRQPSGQRC